jgi:hypothetical protein
MKRLRARRTAAREKPVRAARRPLSSTISNVRVGKGGHEDGIYWCSIHSGDLTVNHVRYNSLSFSVQTKGDKRTNSAGDVYYYRDTVITKGQATKVALRIIDAIEAEFDIALERPQVKQTRQHAAFCRGIIDDRIARQVQITPLEFVPLAMAGGVPRDVARRWLEKKFDRTFTWPEEAA